MKLRSWIMLPFIGAAMLRAQNGLDFEPGQMLDGPRAAASPSPVASPEERVRACEAALALARKRAAEGDGLVKEGVLAKVEAEARVLRVVQAGKELADATVDAAAASADAERKLFNARQASQGDLDAANAALAKAREAAVAASAAWDKARIDAAALDLQRKRKLYAEGACSRRELQMAEDRVLLLTGTVPK